MGRKSRRQTNTKQTRTQNNSPQPFLIPSFRSQPEADNFSSSGLHHEHPPSLVSSNTLTVSLPPLSLVPSPLTSPLVFPSGSRRSPIILPSSLFLPSYTIDLSASTLLTLFFFLIYAVFFFFFN